MPVTGYGRTVGTYTNPDPISIVANGKDIEWKVGGVSIDWSTVTALGSDYNDTTVQNLFVASGGKMLRYGTFMARITKPEVTTLTESASPDGGTFTVTIVVDGGDALTTTDLAFNVSAATMQTALQALANVGSGNLTVGRTGTTTNFVWTLTAAGDLLPSDLTVTASAANLTVSASPGGAIAVATTHAGGEYGWFGPADSGATDGRQTWTNGNVFLLATTLLFQSPFGAALPGPQNVHMGLVSGGPIWEARLLFGSAATPYTAPARTDLPTCMPRLELV